MGGLRYGRRAGAGRFWLPWAFCGELVENVKRAMDVGVPVSLSTNCLAAVLTWVRLLPTEADMSNSRAIDRPHSATSIGGLMRASAIW